MGDNTVSIRAVEIIWCDSLPVTNLMGKWAESAFSHKFTFGVIAIFCFCGNPLGGAMVLA